MSKDRHRLAVLRQCEEQLLATGVPNPARITLALDAAGLHGPEVDRACGVEEPTVELWETGELVPTADQIRALADLCGVRPAMFYGDYQPIPVWLCGHDGCELVDPRPDAQVLDLPATGQAACDHGQTPAVAYMVADNQVLMVVEACRHAVGPAPASDISQALAEHLRTCPPEPAASD
jgi:transcriptional regulator with XRE-family HTH domain